MTEKPEIKPLSPQVNAFFEKVETDKTLQEKLRKLDAKAKDDLDDAIDELVKIADEEGFVFTRKDFIAARSEQPKSLEQFDVRASAKCETFTGVGCMPGMGLYVTVPVPPDPGHCPETYDCVGTYKLKCQGHGLR